MCCYVIYVTICHYNNWKIFKKSKKKKLYEFILLHPSIKITSECIYLKIFVCVCCASTSSIHIPIEMMIKKVIQVKNFNVFFFLFHGYIISHHRIIFCVFVYKLQFQLQLHIKFEPQGNVFVIFSDFIFWVGKIITFLHVTWMKLGIYYVEYSLMWLRTKKKNYVFIYLNVCKRCTYV